MRRHRLLIPLVLLAPLALTAPAPAADTTVRVDDFKFIAKDVKVDVGDTVTWAFDKDGHTTRSNSGQPVGWDSGPATNALGTTFLKTFDTPGRFTYFCEPHQSFMKGTVTVGSDRFAKSQASFKQTREGKKLIFAFRLREPAKVVAKLGGASRRSLTRRRLEPGRHKLAFNRLKAGAYRGTVTFTDDFDKQSNVKTSTVIR